MRRSLLLFLLLALPAALAAATTPAAAGPDAAPVAGAQAAPAPAPAWAAPLRRDARAVLDGPEFRGETTSRDLVPRPWLRRLLEPAAPRHGPGTAELAWLPIVAEGVKWLLVLLLAAAVSWLLWHGWRWLGPQVRRYRPTLGHVELAEPAFQALAAAPLPAAVAAAARAAWQAGDTTRALSLLYRGALRGLQQQYRIPLPASATEGECLRRARATGQDVVASGFAPIVQAWVALAYARRLPEDFEDLLAVYARHFEPGNNGETPR